MNIDFWDFSGSPKHKQIYTCFDCQESLHLAVFSIHTETEIIIRWLSDIQSLGAQRVPVLVVFTHMDTLSNKETREELKRKRTEWLKYNLNQNQQVSNRGTVEPPIKDPPNRGHIKNNLYTLQDPKCSFSLYILNL